MNETMSHSHDLAEEALGLVELVKEVLAVQSIEELADVLLHGITRVMESDSTLLYLAGDKKKKPRFFQQGFGVEAAPKLEDLCARYFSKLSG